jgi:hypothetical protein
MKYSYQKLFLITLFFLPLLYSCERDIEVKLPTPEEKIVVEGWIEQDQYPMVLLTKNSPYFAQMDSAQIVEMIITDAIVTVSDGDSSEVLQLALDANYFPPFVYKGHHLKGAINKTYTLTVEAEGKVLTAQTTILPPIPLDTVWFKVEPQKDSLGYLWATISDPPVLGNCYRLFTKRLHRDNRYFPILGSVYEDSFFNGQTLTFSMNRGIANLTADNMDDPETTYFKKGDTISVRACTIDRTHYDFWRTAEQEMFSGGNPFATPTTVVTNIQGGALGVWGGYGAIYYTVIAN